MDDMNVRHNSVAAMLWRIMYRTCASAFEGDPVVATRFHGKVHRHCVLVIGSPVKGHEHIAQRFRQAEGVYIFPMDFELAIMRMRNIGESDKIEEALCQAYGTKTKVKASVEAVVHVPA